MNSDVHPLVVALLLGSFDFFSNGDILLRRGPDPRSFGDNVRAFRRQTNEQSIEPESEDSGLFRFSLADAPKVSPLQMQKILIQRRHPQGLSTVLAVVGILVYAVWASVL